MTKSISFIPQLTEEEKKFKQFLSGSIWGFNRMMETLTKKTQVYTAINMTEILKKLQEEGMNVQVSKVKDGKPVFYISTNNKLLSTQKPVFTFLNSRNHYAKQHRSR